jgi:hypothetical protein
MGLACFHGVAVALLGGSPTHLAGSVAFLPSHCRLPPHPQNRFGQRSELNSDPLRGFKSGDSFINFGFFGLSS